MERGDVGGWKWIAGVSYVGVGGGVDERWMAVGIGK